MRVAHHLIRIRSGVFYFRQRVPVDLQPTLGRRFLQVSLRTRDIRAARVYSYTVALQYAQAFAELRGRAMPKPPSVGDIVAGAIRPFEMDVDPVTLRPTRIRTDGTDQDTQGAMQALRTLADLRVVFAQSLPPPSAMFPVEPPPPPSLSLSEAIGLYAATQAPSLKPNTWAQRERALKSFAAALGPATPVGTITRERAGDWALQLMTTDSKKLGRPMSKRTAGNMVSHAAQIFEFLSGLGKFNGPNPVKGLVVMSKREKALRRHDGYGWEPFELKALQQVFQPENFSRIGTDHVRWSAVLGLYTGARVSEIAQLHLDDFYEQDGIPCVRMLVDADGKTLKTAASCRIVPLHGDLVRLGLLERVETLREAGEVRLFPALRIDGRAGPGNAVSKGFSYYLRTMLKLNPKRKKATLGFHSLRSTVIQQLQGGTLSAERRRAFVGHELGDTDVHTLTYMRAWTASELADLFPGLTWGKWLDFGGLRKLLVSTANLAPES